MNFEVVHDDSSEEVDKNEILSDNEDEEVEENRVDTIVCGSRNVSICRTDIII